jgi:FtsH-binding integral membrane protein
MGTGVIYRTASEVNSAMLRVYNNMALAVTTSMIVSYLIGMNQALVSFLFTGFMFWIVAFLPLVAVFVIIVALNANPPKNVAILLLHTFAAIMGLSFSVIFSVYTMTSIVSAFFGAAVLFMVMSFYGYFTKQSLDNWRDFLFVGLIAVFIASLVNLFIGSSTLQMVISAIAIIVFLGLTAYDTQKIREEVSVYNNDTVEVIGALTLYLNFINIFLSLLQLFGDKKE